MAQIADIYLASDPNLVSYYRMDSGGLTTDSKGTFTLTNSNSVAEAPSKFGFDTAADFGTNNTNKSLGTANNLGIAGNGSIGISFWLKLNTEISGTNLWVFNMHASTTGGDRYTQVYYYFGTSGTLSFDSSSAGIDVGTLLGTSNWHHFILNRYAGTQAEFYLDNVNIGTFTPGNGLLTQNWFYLGNQSGTQYHASCLIDDVAVFSRALTASEVNLIYNDIPASLDLTSKIW